MASLISKKLARLPIGTHVELTLEKDSSQTRSVCGIVTDSDFSTGLELTMSEGSELFLDYSAVKTFQIQKKLEDILKELPAGAVIRFSHGPESERDPSLIGTVLENDGEESLEIQPESGNELVVSYSQIRSLLLLSGPKPAAKPESKPKQDSQQEKQSPPVPHKPFQGQPGNRINFSDRDLQKQFDELPSDDRKKLSGAYDSFKYGIRVNDIHKITSAAAQARKILFSQDDAGYYWSTEAVKFCGALLNRAKIFDQEVYLVAECFPEAAYCCWRNKEHSLSAAYAMLALLEEAPEDIRDLLLLLFTGITGSKDASGLDLFLAAAPKSMEAELKEMLAELFRTMGKAFPAGLSLAEAAAELIKLLPGSALAEELLYWRPELGKPATAPETPSPAETAQKNTASQPKKESVMGIVTRWDWSSRIGTVEDFFGVSSSFRPEDIADPELGRIIQNCMRADLGGKVYHVNYIREGSRVTQLRLDTAPVERAKHIAQNTTLEDRFSIAHNIIKDVLAAPGGKWALTELIKNAVNLHAHSSQTAPVQEAIRLYEQNRDAFSDKALDIMDLAKCYGCLKKYSVMAEQIDRAMAAPCTSFRQKVPLVQNCLAMLWEYYNSDGSSRLLRKICELFEMVRQEFAGELAEDSEKVRILYWNAAPGAIRAYCRLDMPEQAAELLTLVPERCAEKEALTALVTELQKTHARKAREAAEAARKAEEEARKAEEEAMRAAEAAREAALTRQAGEEPPAEDAQDEDIPPYDDPDGWAALKLTPGEVIDYALGIRHPKKIPLMTAYLRAGAALNPQIRPVYQNVALAVNDPMAAPDYSITSLSDALSGGNSDYPVLNDFCLGAAFLRASFQAGRGYDYATQSLRSSIAVSRRIPALQEAYNLLEEFRKEVSVAMDIYADYRSHGRNQQKKELEEVLSDAEKLYTKYCLNPTRENSSNARSLQTKKLLFGRDSYLAQMLGYIVDQNTDALEGEKEAFMAVWLKNPSSFSASQISARTVSEFVDDAWDEANKYMQEKKVVKLLGSVRTNLVSSVTEILTIVCRWYSLTSQSADLSWRTDQGEAVYRRLRPRLLEQLAALEDHCTAELASCEDPELSTGLLLLADTARELTARLNGSWRLHQEKYMYAEFLRGNYVMLDSDFLPELSATFCGLPDFNILERIRSHIEQEQPSFPEQLQRIYGVDRAHNNYGTALQILEYLEAMDDAEDISLPENPELFHSQTEMQIGMLFDSFLQRYGLAVSYGQIIKTDAFCYTLKDTVHYWYAHCRSTRNYGFFTTLLAQAEKQIHISARQYEQQLDEQLDALIARNEDYFTSHPDFAEAIRTQISSQNFTVAEDWMARIRMQDFSLEVQQPEALDYLNRFWMDFMDNYESASLNGRSLDDSIRRRGIRNKDTRWAQQLIDCWLTSGRASHPDRIRQLLNLLGWQNIHVSAFPVPQDRTAEVYEVRKEFSSDAPIAPLHPIAAFGSDLESRPMYVSCLYGGYDCDKLLEKFRTLDAIDGDKIILLDYTLSQLDRRSLARKLKKRESGLRNVYIVIDRVLITFLAKQFNPNLINRILMAVAMPFSYCQPYVVDSAHTMPPEIFIGRIDELRQIEAPDGVNLIYGGRQLGKSALFKKAVSDLDGRNRKRAVIIDINKLDCPSAARKISAKLIDMGITPDAEETDNWEVLCRNIERRLRRTEDEISYFLLMLDEADTFIADCAAYDYRPLVALKDIQQSLPKRFKYVLAGLHDVVRFNRQVALGNNSVIPHIPYLKVTPFRTPEAQELLTVPLSYLGFSLPSKVTISQILATCNYFPGLIQLYAKKLIESMRGPDYAGYDMGKTPPYIVSDEHLRRVIADKSFNAQIVEKFEGTLRLGEKDGNVYYPLTLLIGYLYSMAPSKGGYTAKELLYHAKDLSIHCLASLEEEIIDALLAELQELNILRSVSNNSYLLASKNFRDLLGSDEEIFDKLVRHGGNEQ